MNHGAVLRGRPHPFGGSMIRTDKQMATVLVLFVLGTFLCGLFFVVSVERARASAQVSRALDHEMSKYACTTQDNGTVVYTKTEDDAEMVAELSAILEELDMCIPVYNEVSIGDWLTITGRDATNAQTVYVGGQGETYTPSNTLIISREFPTVVETNGGWAITFGQ